MMMPSIFGENLFDDWMDSFEEEFFGRKNPLYGKHAKNMMKTDVRETDGTYEVDIDLPGFKKEDISVSFENGYLTVSTNKTLDRDDKDKDGKYIRQERYAGSMSRSFFIGKNIPKEDIKAKYEDGVLRLSVPKKDIKVIENNTINIE
ncbi:Hsp20/alpha crystallin family protein [Thomasclavelia spiroformis]|uniref:Hsp20/alpha crystallin family protein n=1 Tax=Thomasclavelia spiroformis TaxID=29348 RepID=UPI0029437E54|nr:Hsp20/alpha crystallin family protein [Thomasclavelia spiroformis]